MGNEESKGDEAIRLHQATSTMAGESGEMSSHPTLSLITKINLDWHQCRASSGLGFGFDNTAFIVKEGKKENHMLKYSLDRGQYVKEWSKNLPRGFKTISNTYVTAEGWIVLRDEMQELTEVYSSDMEKSLFSFPCKSGSLCGCTLSGLLAYAEEKPRAPNCYRICMYDVHLNHKMVKTLEAPVEEAGMKEWLSICANPVTGWVAVLNSLAYSSTLYIFHKNELPKKVVKLGYPTLEAGGITGTSKVIIVVERHHPCVRVLDWEGKELSEIMLHVDLDHGRWEWIGGIGVGRDRTIQIATGTWPFVSGLKAFRFK